MIFFSWVINLQNFINTKKLYNNLMLEIRAINKLFDMTIINFRNLSVFLRCEITT